MKKFLTAMSILAMLAIGSTVANAAPSDIKVTTTQPGTGTSITVKAYLTGADFGDYENYSCNEIYKSVTIDIGLKDSTGKDVSSEYIKEVVTRGSSLSTTGKGATIEWGGSGSVGLNSTTNTLKAFMAGTGDGDCPVVWDEDGLFATWKVTLNTNEIPSDLSFYVVDALITYSPTGSTTMTNITDIEVSEDSDVITATVAPPSTGGEETAVSAGSFTDAADAKAVAYYVDLTDDASGKTGKWYATFTDAEGNATAKKTNADITVPTFEGGSGRLGLIYKGTETVSAVSFKWN